ncbi:hypothetical protein [Aliiglaciecola sp. LCG003]|uniref:hypothetical protein n=1 Tax=Aliiglaciecola sp. LCG003 TaxID=3053655 RepID=UPI002573736D|nr:hypothetical protein [Aliiglaciecola sp. LCG003]WJG08458.1 hypothetical protein QR722_14075 [Aliiglaciecola sp. LCG003]
MNEFNKTTTKDVSVVKKRRNFLKKTATGAVIASLPAKSVWGTCAVSGAMSGNLSQNAGRHTCTIPDLGNGMHPIQWKDWDNHYEDCFLSLKAKKKEIYDNRYRDSSWKEREYRAECEKYTSVINTCMNSVLRLPQELNPINKTCRGALDTWEAGSSGIYSKLAAVYLNAFFGFYDGYHGDHQAQELTEQVFLYWYIENHAASTGQMLSRNDQTFRTSSLGISDYDLGFDGTASTQWKPV